MRHGSGGGTVHGPPGRPFVQILADRMAAVFARHEPGYPLPRRTALCRRFQATDADIDAAVGELVRRQLLRRLPTGEVHRAGPAEYLISLPGLPGLSSVIDPMDHIVSCTAARISRQRAPADVAEVLGMAQGTQLNVRRCAWSADGEPAAASATYVPDEHISLITATPSSGQGAPDGSQSLAGELALPGLPGEPDAAVHAGAVRIEVQPPARSIARRLRLASGAPAVILTVRFDDDRTGCGAAAPSPDVPHAEGGLEDGNAAVERRTARPVALKVITMRANLFRIVLETSGASGQPAIRGDNRDGGLRLTPVAADP